MKVRRVTEEDRSEVRRLVAAFLRESPYAKLLNPDDPAVVDGLFEFGLSSGVGWLLTVENDDGIEVARVGLIALTIQDYVKSKLRVAEELVWYVDPRFRGRESLALLVAAEQFATISGADVLKMLLPYGSRVAELLTHRGFWPIEQAHMKWLGAREAPDVVLQRADRPEQEADAGHEADAAGRRRRR